MVLIIYDIADSGFLQRYKIHKARSMFLKTTNPGKHPQSLFLNTANNLDDVYTRGISMEIFSFKHPSPTLLSYQSKAKIRKEPEIFDSAAWYIVQMVKNLPAMQETQVSPLCCVDPLEEEMATHSRILAWRIPWTKEPASFPSMGSQKVEHDWVSNTHIYIFLCQWVIVTWWVENYTSVNFSPLISHVTYRLLKIKNHMTVRVFISSSAHPNCSQKL